MKTGVAVAAAALLALGAGNASAQSQTAGNKLEHCDEMLGTLAVVEDHKRSASSAITSPRSSGSPDRFRYN